MSNHNRHTADYPDILKEDVAREVHRLALLEENEEPRSIHGACPRFYGHGDWMSFGIGLTVGLWLGVISVLVISVFWVRM